MLLLVLPFSGMAQLSLYPIQNKSKDLSPTQSRTHSLSPMKLPFWDDFSSKLKTDTLWENQSTVWINSGVGIDPPTIMVATFDGLDANGVPYSLNPNQSLDFGFTDSLIARRIKMTDVPLFQRNSVFLSFFYQWGGFGETPDPNDFLLLEFLSNTGVWDRILTLKSNDLQEFNKFYSASIRVNEDKYYHDDFQFRFRSSGRKSGRYDTWNIDYLYMNKGRSENDLQQGFPDRAPFINTTSLFEKYYAIPQRHFKTNTADHTGFPTFALHNLSNIPQPMNYDIHGDIKQFTNGVVTDESINIATAQSILPSVQAFERRSVTFTTKPDLSTYASADSLQITLRTTLITGDSVNTGFEPINFYSNDTIRQTYTLKDFYAYDDGTAEYAIGLTQSGNLAAYRFVMKTNIKDTLNGVYVHYPYTSGTSASIVTFYVWANKNGVPGQLLLEEIVPVQRRANSSFILRPFIQSTIVQDTFFIGWRQPVTGRVQIGLDASHDTGNHLLVNVTGTWQQNTLIKGSAMIRPRFGKGEIVTAVEEEPSKVSIYPNPNPGEFIIQGECSNLQIISLTGQMVPFETEVYETESRVRIADPTAGLYILRYHSGNKFFVEKIIVRKN